jgi:hypothetical protein
VVELVDSLLTGTIAEVNATTDFVSDSFAAEFGDLLLFHHNASAIAMSKDKFEFAMVDALTSSGFDATKMRNGNPGADIIVDGVPWSLKTQANAAIKTDLLHISKFMELGKGRWETLEDLTLLREQMFEHLKSYERILVLRNLSRVREPDGQVLYVYELVEIPKLLLLSASNFPIIFSTVSRQNPVPASSLVLAEDGSEAYRLYFDGGTERKLQIRAIRKDLCVVHATWRFHTR